jgi:hypothetical protein
MIRFGAGVLCLGFAHAAAARVLDVGPHAPIASIGAAARDARDGDTVHITAGTYYECAAWGASHLTIEGDGPATVITDNACQGKAAFVIVGNDVTVRDLVLTRVRVADGNGAGIRGEGRDLTLDGVGFVNNQYGLLVGANGGTLRLLHCRFDDNGASPDGRPTHAISAAGLDRLSIEDSSFSHERTGDYIFAHAGSVAITGSRFSDSGGGMRGALIQVSGGSIALAGNTIDLAEAAADRPGAILATGDAGHIEVRGNTLIEPGHAIPLLRDWTGGTTVQQDNHVPQDVAAVSDSGRLWHGIRGWLGRARDQALRVKGVLRHVAGAVADRL